MIQSFAPGEITPEKALKIGIELCQKFLKEEYQYYLAVHTDKEHIHLHCIFNNTRPAIKSQYPKSKIQDKF